MKSRRSFLKQCSDVLGTSVVTAAFGGLYSRRISAETAKGIGYGALRPTPDETTGLELLQLPEGFRYLSYGWTGDPMSDGTPTPGVHDGMSVISAEGSLLTLCRNHELKGNGRSFAPAEMSYDPLAPGGCSNLLFDAAAGKWMKSIPSISGTLKNCAGGPTPWGTWLTCEETVFGPGDDDDGLSLNYQRDHGWIFEVPSGGVSRPTPLKGMGRFVHEAIAVDPQTGIVYETEDAKTAGFYRFLPNSAGNLGQGGRLQMLSVANAADLRSGPMVGARFDVSWVDIEDPEKAHSDASRDGAGVFSQGKLRGGTTFARLEGCWFGNSRVYFVSTNGGKAQKGQIWEFDPVEQNLRLIYESEGADHLDSPDNIAVSPRGWLVLCEDGDVKPQRLHGLTTDGRMFPLAANHVTLRGERNGFEGDFRDSEWAGASFSPDGRWLFVNIQDPGITFAITGPWEDVLL